MVNRAKHMVNRAKHMVNRAKTEKILQKIAALREETGISRTLFAACPNSRAVIRASFRAAKRNNAPIKFATTLNQVDQDGGYTGMTHRQFAGVIRKEAARINFTGPVIIAVDHGGPWLRDNQRTARWSLRETMDWVKRSFSDAIDAGFDLLHVDPTVDIQLPPGEILPISLVAHRTVELIRHCEEHRKQEGLPPVSYEVGTEEVHGGLADIAVFGKFLELLKTGLEEAGHGDVWPCFVVGKVGTDLHTTLFDPETAKILTAIAGKYGSLIKGHYTDNVENPEAYPVAGMGAANVGPEFTEREYDALMELDMLEARLVDGSKLSRGSEMKETLWKAVIDSGRWKKWVQEGESPDDFSSIAPGRQQWLVKTGCRYIWEDPRVTGAREVLYRNLDSAGIDAEAIVLAGIENAMDKYFFSFNLVNLNAHLEE
jgi:D-tagatose-1,6-bisphosphate aldolase subunit GatZ/KbaZ